MNNLKIILSVILGGLLAFFIIQNFAVVNIKFMVWTLSISSSLLMFLLFLTGFVLGWLQHSFSIHKKKKRQNEEKMA